MSTTLSIPDSFRLSRRELKFGLLISSIHGMQHLYTRLVPALIPVLVVGLEIPLWQLGVLVTVFLFVGGIFQAPMGIVSDVVDRKYLVVPAIVLMALGYLVFAAAPLVGSGLGDLLLRGHVFTGTYLVMILGMCVAGVGFSGIHPAGYPLISANVARENKGKVLGMWASAAKVGDTAAPLLVGVLIILIAWESVLVIVSLLGLVYAAALLVILRRDTYETKPQSAAIDRYDTDDSNAGSGVDSKAFVYPMGVMLLFFFAIMFATNGLLTFTPVFVSEVYAFSFSVGAVEIQPDSVANFYFAVLLFSGAVSQLLTGGLADAFDHRGLLIGLLGVSTIALVVVTFVALTPVTLLLLFVLLGACLFGIYPPRDALISDLTPAAYEGRAFGYIFTLGMVVGSAYPAIIGLLAERVGIQTSFTYLAVSTVIGAGLIALLYSSRITRAV